MERRNSMGGVFSSIFGGKPSAPAPAAMPAVVAAPTSGIDSRAQDAIDKKRKASLLSMTDITKGTGGVGSSNVGQKQLLGQ